MYFGMKVHFGGGAESGLLHTVRGTSGKVHDVVEGNSSLHAEEIHAFGNAGYQGTAKSPDAITDVTWHLAMRPGKRKALNQDIAVDAMIDKVKNIKAGVRVKVARPFRLINRRFGSLKVRYRGLKNNTALLVTLFAL